MIDLYRKSDAKNVEDIYRAHTKNDKVWTRFTTKRNSITILHGRYKVHIRVPDELADRILTVDAEYDDETHYWVRCDRLSEEHFVKLM